MYTAIVLIIADDSNQCCIILESDFDVLFLQSLNSHFQAKLLISGGYVCELLRRCYRVLPVFPTHFSVLHFSSFSFYGWKGGGSDYRDTFSALKLPLLAKLGNVNLE